MTTWNRANNTNDSFSQRVIRLVKSIPPGRVATYAQIAVMAGNPRGARGVAWILHSSSGRENLPWHRVINSKGRISLPKGAGWEEQKALLEAEGIGFNTDDSIELAHWLFSPGKQ